MSFVIVPFGVIPFGVIPFEIVASKCSRNVFLVFINKNDLLQIVCFTKFNSANAESPTVIDGATDRWLVITD